MQNSFALYSIISLCSVEIMLEKDFKTEINNKQKISFLKGV